MTQGTSEPENAALQRQRETFGSLLVMVGPLLVGAVIFIAAGMFTGPHLGIRIGVPVLALIGLWLVVAWWLQRRLERARLRRLAEIEATRVEHG